MPIRSAMTSKDPNPARYTAALFLITLGLFVFLCRNDGLWTYFLLHYHAQGIIFGDWYAVTAAIDAHQMGIDVFKESPFDYVARPHVYSGLWLELGHLRLDRFDGVYVAGAIVICSIGVISRIAFPENKRQLTIYLFLCVSPPFMLAYERANNDLIIFLLLACLIPTIKRGQSGIVIGCMIVAFAAMLKYYPMAAFIPLFLYYGSNCRTILWVGFFATLAAAQIIHAGELFGPLRETMPNPIYLFTIGGPNPFIYFGYEEGLGTLTARMLFVTIALTIFLFWIKKPIEPNSNEASSLTQRQTLFLLGAAIIIGCFVLRSGFFYRLIFCVFSFPLINELWQHENKSYRYPAKAWTINLLAIAWMENLTYNGAEIMRRVEITGPLESIFALLYPANYFLEWTFIGIYTFIACGIIVQSGWIKRLPFIRKILN